MAAFKDLIGPELVESLAGFLARAWPPFPRDAFVAAGTTGLTDLELMARTRYVAAALGPALPADFPTAAGIVRRSLEDPGLTGWMTLPVGYWVSDAGIDQPETALPLLAALTPRCSSEGPIRYFIDKHPDVTFAYLDRWAGDPDEHVRRLVSEGTRPRLPWAQQLRQLMADPTPSIPLLDRLHDDPSDYVRRSVANHLNDIAKDHPGLAVEIATRWSRTDAGMASPGAAWVVRHGLRTLVKQGDPAALALLGYSQTCEVRLTGLRVTPDAVPIGARTTLQFTLTAPEPTKVVVDYAVHHAGARGPRSPKVFKLMTATLQPGQPLAVERSHAFREVTVRRLYPGEHRIDIQVNGRVLGSAVVTLLPAPAVGTA